MMIVGMIMVVNKAYRMPYLSFLPLAAVVSGDVAAKMCLAKTWL